MSSSPRCRPASPTRCAASTGSSTTSPASHRQPSSGNDSRPTRYPAAFDKTHKNVLETNRTRAACLDIAGLRDGGVAETTGRAAGEGFLNIWIDRDRRSMATTHRDKLNKLYTHLASGTPLTSADLAVLGISADL